MNVRQIAARDGVKLGPGAVGRLLVVFAAVGWGVGWPIMKLLMHDWPPLFARGAAGMLATIALTVVAAFRGERLLPSRASLGPLVLAATINVFAWMGFTALSLQWLHVSEAALLTYTMPIWATLFAWPMLGERPNTRSVAALCLGVAGLCLLVGTDLHAGLEKLPGIGLALCAAVLFALGAVTSRREIPLPPIALIAWLLGLGSIAMIVLAGP